MTSFWFLQVDVQVQSKGNNTVHCQMQIANTAKLQMNTIKQKVHKTQFLSILINNIHAVHPCKKRKHEQIQHLN
jgi:hypothetical protein